jgi:hypothetical protein
VSIHSAMRGKMTTINGKMPSVSELNSSPSPSICEELFCRSERLTTYLEKILMKPMGSRAGIPA